MYLQEIFLASKGFIKLLEPRSQLSKILQIYKNKEGCIIQNCITQNKTYPIAGWVYLSPYFNNFFYTDYLFGSAQTYNIDKTPSIFGTRL